MSSTKRVTRFGWICIKSSDKTDKSGLVTLYLHDQIKVEFVVQRFFRPHTIPNEKLKVVEVHFKCKTVFKFTSENRNRSLLARALRTFRGRLIPVLPRPPLSLAKRARSNLRS